MARFHFDLDYGDGTIIDNEGTELPDLDAARREATETLIQFARHVLPGRTAAMMLVRIRQQGAGQVLEARLTFDFSASPVTAT